MANASSKDMPRGTRDSSASAPMPLRPLDFWERADKVNLVVLSFGWQGKCSIVRMHLPMDHDVQRLHDATRGLMRDVKHSRNWRCEFCGDFSRETQVQTVTRASVNPPRVIMSMHHICDHDKDACFKQMEKIHQEVQRLEGLPPSPLPRPPRKPLPPTKAYNPPKTPRRTDWTYPRAGSCAGCQTDSSLLGVLQACEKCHLTR
ncbi:hypothetical protein C8Q79DRAFT_990710 [Trametes meyenii]|nr:hypothetical protein C8Q79DRAFT_990710 [Trametes meyenii]